MMRDTRSLDYGSYVYASLEVHLRALPPAFAERRRGFCAVRGVRRTLTGFVERRVSRTLFGGFGEPYLRLSFCGFDALRLPLAGVLTEMCTHTTPLH